MNHKICDTQLDYVQTEDKRPDPKPRKHPQLWQAYLWWNTIMETRKASNLRISSISKGKSSMDKIFEKEMAQGFAIAYLIEYAKADMLPVKKLEKAAQQGTAIDILLDNVLKGMTDIAKKDESLAGIWSWMLSFRGIGESLAAQFIAQIDDIERFETVSKLWRFCGFAVIDGRREYNAKGETSHYNRRLKATCYLIADQFIKQRTPYYSDIYYAEKERLRELHPDIICRQCSNGTEKLWSDCEQKKKHSRMYNDGHIHNMAWRKMIKTFLKDLWIEWRKANHYSYDTQIECVP